MYIKNKCHNIIKTQLYLLHLYHNKKYTNTQSLVLRPFKHIFDIKLIKTYNSTHKLKSNKGS